MATVVSAAQVDSQHHAWFSRRLKASIVRLDRFVESVFRVHLHFGLDPSAPLRVQVVAVARSIDLDVLYAIRRERGDVLLDDLDDVPQQSGVVLVNFVRNTPLERDRRKLGGAWQQHLDVTRAVFSQERKFVRRHRTQGAKFRIDDSGHMADMRLSLLPLGSPDFRTSRDFRADVETLDSVGEIAHEIPPPQLAVGEDLETKLLLLCEHSEDVLVLNSFQSRAIGVIPR